MMGILRTAVCCAVGVIAIPANAATVSVTIAGYNVADLVYGQSYSPDNATFSATFDYNSDDVGFPSGFAGDTTYYGAISNAVITIGSDTYSSTFSRIDVANDENGNDGLSFDFSGLVGASFANSLPSDFGFALRDGSASAFSSQALPTSFDISEFTNGNGGNSSVFSYVGGQRYGVITSASGSTAAVPESATWAMMIAGFGLVGGVTRRRRNTTVAYV
jgi:hypothetical protein